LSNILISKSLASLQFYNQPIINEEIRVVVTEEGPVLVVHRQGKLLFNVEPSFIKAMGKGIFVNLFEMTVAQKAMDIERGFADDIP